MLKTVEYGDIFLGFYFFFFTETQNSFEPIFKKIKTKISENSRIPIGSIFKKR